jgi:dTDP-L-rhamnose 4-epimerase
MYEMRRYVETNVVGTASLLEECLAGGVEKCVLSSSRAVYGEGTWWCEGCGRVHPPIRERLEGEPANWSPRCPRCRTFTSGCVPTAEGETLLPTSVYGVSKAAQEQLVNVVEHASGMSCATLRFFNVFGPGQALSNPYTGVLAVFANRARAGKPIELFEDGEILRDFVYVDDVVESLVQALSCSDPGPFNIGSGEGVTIRRLAQSIVDLTCSGSSIGVTGKMRIGDVRGLVADIRRAEAGLSWKPTTKFEEGLRRFVEWAMGREFEDLYEDSMEELRQRGLYR